MSRPRLMHGRRSVSASLDIRVVIALDAYAVAEGMSLSGAIEELLLASLQKSTYGEVQSALRLENPIQKSKKKLHREYLDNLAKTLTGEIG